MKQIPVILFGAGGVGRALIQQIVDGRQAVAERNRTHFQVIAVADSQRWLFDPNELTDEQLLDVITAKKNRRKLGDERPEPTAMLKQIEAAGIERAIVIDVTAAAGMETTLTYALDKGHAVVLANKKPLAGPWETAQRFFNEPNLRHESTVGGGQPVIATLRYLLDTSDPVLAIEGQLSGSIGYLCQRLDEDVPFSRALAEAKAFGYTEPDPRDDLGGLDVMRKILILARMAGWPLEQSDIEVESLYPSSLSHLSVPEFMAAAVSIDPSMQDRVAAARAAGNVLRFIAQVSEGQGSVSLNPVPQASALANLKYISFQTERYNDEKMVIAGKGAGVSMTAAGVHGDMIDLAREQW